MTVVCPFCFVEVFDGLDSDYAYCTECDELVLPIDEEEGALLDEAWCEGCGDTRPMDEDGCCMRCGEEVGS